jgi:glycosyltransferase involved in cell wall biosynthesis
MLGEVPGTLEVFARDGERPSDELAVASSALRLKVFVMDLWCYTAYYDRYLCQGLMNENIEVTLGSVCPYQDPGYFARNGMHNHPGLLDIVPRLQLSSDSVRRMLMLVESCINMMALLVRFALSKSKPDVVHVQWIPLVRRLPFELWFLKLVKRLGIRLVYTVHNLLPHDTGRRFVPLFRCVYNEMDALICHSEETKRRLIDEFSVNPSRVWVIPHGPLLHDAQRVSVEASKAALSLPQDETLVLWQGFIREYKGLDFLLEAWRKVDANNLGACLVIAGSGEPGLLKGIKEDIDRLGLQESVRLDFRFIPDEELPTYYQASDLLVYPYKEVTTSGALMTALAYEKPIVATNLPAFQEVLRDQENALLVNYGDVNALANSLRRLIQEPKERERLARGVASSDNFNSWSRIAKKTRQCYTSVLRNAREESVS